MFHLYVFRHNTGRSFDAYIVKDNAKLAMAHVTSGINFGGASVSLELQLQASDRVHCHLASGNLHSFCTFGPVHFSGFLIAEIP